MLTAVLQRVRSNAALVRQPFKLVTSDKPVSRLASKIGGTRPYLPTGTQWPKCGDCEEPMRFFLQFDLSLLPNESPDKASCNCLCVPTMGATTTMPPSPSAVSCVWSICQPVSTRSNRPRLRPSPKLTFPRTALMRSASWGSRNKAR